MEREWEHLLQTSQKLTFRKDQVLFYEGHNPCGVFVIQSGKVRFSREGREGHSCHVEHTWRSTKGEVLGLHHFLDEAAYCCTCSALKDCRVLFISKTQLLPFVEKA